MKKLLLVFTIITAFMACKTNTDKKKKKEDIKNEISESDVWKKADKIIADIIVPQFQDQLFDITEYGAVADGTTNNSEAFKKAIAACNEAGGGKVIVPEGKYLTGPIHLKSNVNLHLSEGAEVLFSKDANDYLPAVHTSYEGVELMNYSPLIYAFEQENIAVTGKGTFNGQADNDNWWPWSGAERYGHKEGEAHQKQDHNLPALRRMNEENTPVSERKFGKGHQLRPTFFQPFGCENVLVKDVTFTNAPFWVIHPIKSNNVTVDGVTVNSHGPNNDGCDPEYAKNVHIKNCLFNTGDDCIAIKSGRNNDGRRVAIPSENIVVEDCNMKDGHGGVVMGSEISAGVRNVYVRNCIMDSPNLDRAIRIKTNTLRGGFVDGVYVKNIEVGQVKEAMLKVNLHYGIYDNQEGEFFPNISNIYLEDINVENAGKYGILIIGREGSKISNINLKNITIKGAETATKITDADPVNYENVTINGSKME
ncbi:glycoside hydrolase family 28 protein [Zunongwangia sp. HGR-M22]|uniref:glycoside hydrolase family 28 protein n=1 Tax=Zunongwangia sp. HGR-M22 TaxID=3015168 RepID=UPI0022DD025D|nr:glycoside hydrolase family 28 protein [Zunongwangia sp. HGR-M22]WBL24720.1 glycoside hydrolase family 28 protein [Zunongwangia sp. HGR-M22]